MNAPRAEPLFFGPDTRPCFGWLHAPPPVEARAPRLGLVICNPFGFEAASAHRSLRHFAEAAVRLGVPALRFDYDGTGDSAGDDRDPGRWEAWVTSVHHAIDALRRSTGAQRVCLLGVRLGATLATTAATQRDDVAGLVAIAPVLAGKAWLRELSVLQTMTGFAPAPPGFEADPGDQEALGFVLTAETRTAVGGLNLLGLNRPPAPDMLILDRDDLPDDARFAEHLRTIGVRVERRRSPGYVQMMLDSHEAVVPAEMIREVSTWLERRVADAGPAPVPTPGTAFRAAAAVAPLVEESAVFLDDARLLFGIVSAPAGAGRPTRAIVLVNSGAIQHSGPSRLYVKLARRWAARGYVVLRIDVAGIGDSLPRPGEPENVVYAAGAVADVVAAAAYLTERWGTKVLMGAGLCSGAYHALKAAVAGAPFAAVAIVNPLVFFWKPGMSLAYPTYQISEATARYKRSVFQPDKWKKLLAGKVDVGAFAQVVLRRVALRTSGLLRNLARSFGRPMVDDLGAELETVADRGVDIQFVFATGDPGEDLLRVRGGWTVPRLLREGRLHIHRIVGPNHAFTPIWSQAALTAVLEDALGVR